jgi:hypoxanthine-guanine phosphoribosyltransferase
VDEGGATFTDTLQTHLTQAGIEVVRGSLKLRSMHGTRSSERIQLDRELDVPVAGEYVCVCDDIDDRRFTQRFLRGYFDGMGALSVKYAMNLSKRGVPDRLLDIPDPDYVGLYIDNLFVVGRNLDYNEEGRELSDLYAEISERSLLEELAEMYDLQDRLLHLQTAAA